MKISFIMIFFTIGLNLLLFNLSKINPNPIINKKELQLSTILNSQTNIADSLSLNPFNPVQYSSFNPLPKKKKLSKETLSLPNIKIQTLFLGGNPVAQIIVNGKSNMVKIGDLIQNVKILNILKNGIEVVFNGEKHFISK